ncbi:hypothetical protein H5410_014376 [Solanum commersonii]|uniref:Uncharacterized protein n=1 Tax=Solanum commersonii TaxID=4109 RepID=A0A9J5ZQV2_SOLCO|nr:hypothetical protein H5410_014376 [Solanum commersonii]
MEHYFEITERGKLLLVPSVKAKQLKKNRQLLETTIKSLIKSTSVLLLSSSLVEENYPHDNDFEDEIPIFKRLRVNENL